MPGVEVLAPLAVPSPPVPKVACTKHSVGDQYMVLENGRFAYLSMPPQFRKAAMAAKLCVIEHRPKEPTWDPLSMCCLQEGGHVHAHVHHGEITEDIFLEQCMDDAGCALPMPWEMSALLCKPVPNHDSDHEHSEDCGHDQIAHGDHFDWLVPLRDGSFILSHAQKTENGGPRFIEHGRLVNLGETLGKLKWRPKQLVYLFSYETPKRNGYECLPHTDPAPKVKELERTNAFNSSPDSHCLTCTSECQAGTVRDGVTAVTIPNSSKTTGLGKTTMDVMGICCPNEVPLIKKLLEPISGVEEVSVNVTSKTVTVLHDRYLVPAVQLVKVLNDASMSASVHRRGEWKAGRKWPSPWNVASGVLLALSFFQYLYSPLKWVALGSVGVGIPPLIIRSIAALKSLVLDINILMLIAVGGAIGLGDYLEAGSIAFLFTLADWLESRSSDKARAAIAAVVDRAPRNATLLSSGASVHVEDVKVGTLVAVKAGEMVPIDGTVISGKCNVDESSLTGESMPVEKDIGSNVWAGTVNMSGHLTVQTTALAEDSAVSRMVRLVEEAQTQRSRTEILVEQIAKYYTPGIVVAAAIIAVVPWALHVQQHRHWLYLALVLLVVACPCALVISTPVVTTCGIAQAARLGLLVKGGSFLDILGRLKVVALDKTGTLSEGQFRVTDVLGIDGNSNVQHILHWVASVENKASHPMASALVSFAGLHGVKPVCEVKDFEVIVGEGVTATVDGRTIHIGNARMASRLGWEKGSEEIVDAWSGQGDTVGWIGVDMVAVGVFGAADQLRKEAVEAVRNLKQLGIRVAMLTGDSMSAASFAHKKIGDIEIHSQLLPEDKVRIVQELKKIGITAMVGDGINDAPALAAADVGIAMGVAGSAVAMETADVALMTNDLRKLATAVELGRDCRWKIGQNVTLSFVTKLTIIGLAAGGYASLWTAVLADVGTCLLVIFNSMRLLKPTTCGDPCCTKNKYTKTNAKGFKKKNQGKVEICCSNKDPGLDMMCLDNNGLMELCDEALPNPRGQTSRLPWRKPKHCHAGEYNTHDLKKTRRPEISRGGLSTATSSSTGISNSSTEESSSAPCCASSRSEQHHGGSKPRGKPCARAASLVGVKEKFSLSQLDHELGDSFLSKFTPKHKSSHGVHHGQKPRPGKLACCSRLDRALVDNSEFGSCNHLKGTYSQELPKVKSLDTEFFLDQEDHQDRPQPGFRSRWPHSGPKIELPPCLLGDCKAHNNMCGRQHGDDPISISPGDPSVSPHGLAVLSSLDMLKAKPQSVNVAVDAKLCTRMCCRSRLLPAAAAQPMTPRSRSPGPAGSNTGRLARYSSMPGHIDVSSVACCDELTHQQKQHHESGAVTTTATVVPPTNHHSVGARSASPGRASLELLHTSNEQLPAAWKLILGGSCDMEAENRVGESRLPAAPVTVNVDKDDHAVVFNNIIHKSTINPTVPSSRLSIIPNLCGNPGGQLELHQSSSHVNLQPDPAKSPLTSCPESSSSTVGQY